MANTNAPFGFKPWKGTGSPPTFELSVRTVDKDDTGAIYRGDMVVPVTGSATGYIKQGTASTVAAAGIFWGCKYLSTSQKRTVWSNYWPGSDAAADVEAYVIDDPNMQFEVQSSDQSASLPIPFAKIGQLINISVGTGSTATGLSGMTVDYNTINTTATLPFRIVGLIESPPGAPGTDITTEYNRVVVAWNNVITRSNGALTGIS